MPALACSLPPSAYGTGVYFFYAVTPPFGLIA